MNICSLGNCTKLPCLDRNPLTSASSGELQGRRISPKCGIMPGLLTLATCITAIVCTIIWNVPLLSIAFVPGALASMYVMYLGWNYHQLQNFQESNQALKQSINELDIENQKLKESVVEFNQENEKLKSSVEIFEQQNLKLKDSLLEFSTENEKLKTSVCNFDLENQKLSCSIDDFNKENIELSRQTEHLTEENAHLERLNGELEKTVHELDSVKSLLEEKAAAHVQNLKTLQDSLQGIETSSKENHSEFKVHLLEFITATASLKQSRNQIGKAGSKISQAEKNMTQFSKTLVTIHTQIADLIAKKPFEKLFDKLEGLKEETAKREGILEQQQKQLDELSSLRQNLSGEIDELSQVRKDLSNEVKKLSGSFEEIQRESELFYQN